VTAFSSDAQSAWPSGCLRQWFLVAFRALELRTITSGTREAIILTSLPAAEHSGF